MTFTSNTSGVPPFLNWHRKLPPASSTQHALVYTDVGSSHCYKSSENGTDVSCLRPMWENSYFSKASLMMDMI